MKKFLALSLIGAVALASCNQANVTGSSKTYTFAAQAQTGYTVQAGTAARTDLNTGDTSTVLKATGLKPSTAYIAHYHLAGADVSKGVCASGGAVQNGLIGGTNFTSDASGNLTIKGLASTADIAVGSVQYINIHEAATPAVVPLCADLTVAAK
jgi:Cu-Zn family superoxide dismutase